MNVNSSRKVDIVVAKQGMGMTEATLVEWTIEVGGRVTAGQPIAIVQTDKVDMSVDAPVSGVLVAVHVAANEDFEVPGIIGVIEQS